MPPTSHSTPWVAAEFDRRAATYDGNEMHRWQAQRAAQLLDLLPGQRILDIATGTGLAARATSNSRSGRPSSGSTCPGGCWRSHATSPILAGVVTSKATRSGFRSEQRSLTP